MTPADKYWYASLALWLLVAIANVIYVWVQVTRQDQKLEAEEVQRAEDDKLWGEMWDAMEVDRLKGKSAPTEDGPFMLDDDNLPKGAIYEKAQKLGFTDEPPKPRAA